MKNSWEILLRKKVTESLTSVSCFCFFETDTAPYRELGWLRPMRITGDHPKLKEYSGFRNAEQFHGNSHRSQHVSAGENRCHNVGKPANRPGSVSTFTAEEGVLYQAMKRDVHMKAIPIPDKYAYWIVIDYIGNYPKAIPLKGVFGNGVYHKYIQISQTVPNPHFSRREHHARKRSSSYI